MASTRVNQVLNGLRNLTATERIEIATILGGTGTPGGGAETTRLTESFSKALNVSTGPISQVGCACCGKA